MLDAILNNLPTTILIEVLAIFVSLILATIISGGGWSKDSRLPHFGNRVVGSITFVVCLLFFTAANFLYFHQNYIQTLLPAPAPTETPTPVPTDTPIPTFTPVPTDTPVPTHTPAPTDTPIPTHTPAPTDTPIPTQTPAPTDTPTPTPTTDTLQETDAQALSFQLTEAISFYQYILANGYPESGIPDAFACIYLNDNSIPDFSCRDAAETYYYLFCDGSGGNSSDGSAPLNAWYFPRKGVACLTKQKAASLYEDGSTFYHYTGLPWGDSYSVWEGTVTATHFFEDGATKTETMDLEAFKTWLEGIVGETEPVEISYVKNTEENRLKMLSVQVTNAED